MKQPKRRKRLNPNTLQLIRQIVGGILVFTLVGLIITAIWYVTRLEFFTISKVSVSGGETISHDLVTTLVESELEGEYFRLVPKRFSLLYPHSKIMSSVGEINRIKNLEVKRSSLKALQVTFDEYIPDSLWCAVGSNECVFLDEFGYAFAKSPQLTGGSFLRLDKIGVKPVIGIQAFSTDDYSRVKQLISLLEERNWFVKDVAIDSAGDAYFHLTEGGELKIVLANHPPQVIDNLFTAISSPEFTEIRPGNFEYIDLRFGNRVFVNELEPEVATSSEDTLE